MTFIHETKLTNAKEILASKLHEKFYQPLVQILTWCEHIHLNLLYFQPGTKPLKNHMKFNKTKTNEQKI